MRSPRRSRISSLIIALLVWGLAIPPLPARAAEPTPPFEPVWSTTGERIPKEVKKLEDKDPVSWCETQETVRGIGSSLLDKFKLVATYQDSNTGTKTTVRRTATKPNPIAPPYGTTSVTDLGVVWEITIETPGQPTRKLTYQVGIGQEGTDYVIEKIGDQDSVVRDIKEGDLVAPSPKRQPPLRKGALPHPLSPTRMARVNFTAPDPASPAKRESDPPTLLAATQEQPQGQTLKSQERPLLNMKLVTYGGPLTPPPVVQLDPPPQTTPEEFVQTPPPVTWTPEDKEGPKTTPPPEDPKSGIPITFIPGGGINIGSGWASARVLGDFISSCVEDDGADGTRTAGRPQKPHTETPQSPGSPAVASAPKQACTWITVPRDDVPDFAGMISEKEAKANSALAEGISDPTGAQQQCPLRKSMFQSPPFSGFSAALPLGAQLASNSPDALSPDYAAIKTLLLAQSSDPGPTVTSPTGPLPETRFGQNRTNNPLIPEGNRIGDIQDQMTRNSGRDDLLQRESWAQLQNSIAWATAAIRNCDRGNLEFALDGILASTRRLQRRKQELEDLRDKVGAGLDKQLGQLMKDIDALPKPFTQQSRGSQALTTGKIGLVLYELIRFLRHGHPPTPLLIPLDIYAVYTMFCTVAQWTDVQIRLKYDFPRLLDRLEKVNDLSVLIRQYEMRLDANNEAINALGKAYDEHKCKKCVEPGSGTVERPGTRPRTGGSR